MSIKPSAFSTRSASRTGVRLRPSEPASSCSFRRWPGASSPSMMAARMCLMAVSAALPLPVSLLRVPPLVARTTPVSIQRSCHHIQEQLSTEAKGGFWPTLHARIGCGMHSLPGVYRIHAPHMERLMAALRATDVTKRFGGVRALDCVSLALEPGEIQGLIGPNGSGKTTLLNIISGWIEPTEGSVTVDEVPVTGWSADRVARIGVARTFQNLRLFRRLTVLENIEVGVTGPRARRKSKDSRRTARAMLDELGISRYASQLSSELPYGLQRRVEIARALARSPRYLLLDEPAAGMNEVESDDLRDIIKRISSSRGCGVLVIDHDLRFITALCSKIQVLNEGRSIALDTPERVQVHPAVIEAYVGGRTAVSGANAVSDASGGSEE